MANLIIKKSDEFVSTFLDHYLSNGFGSFNKKDIDILVMDLLIRYGELDGKSNQELSILLKTPVTRIKGLRYEARLKYPPEENYVNVEFMNIISKSIFDFENNKVTFSIEDDYIRHAITGKLKEGGMFADSSFNRELVRIDQKSLEAVMSALYGPEVAGDFKSGFDEMMGQAEDEGADPGSVFMSWIGTFAAAVLQSIASAGVKSIAGM